VETDEHMIYLQLLFCKLQKESKTVFAALRQSPGRDFNIKVASLQSCPPDTMLALRSTRLKEQETHSAIGRRRLF